MSAGTVPSGSSSGGSQLQSGTEAMDQSAYIYTLPENERIIVCHYLNQKFGEKNELTISSPVILNNGGKYVWEEAARIMGYTANDIIVSLSYIYLARIKYVMWSIDHTI